LAQGRRTFIRQAATGATALLGLQAKSAEAATSSAPSATPPDNAWPDDFYLCFNPQEAQFVEALVNQMCPPDDLTPGGVECGLAIFIDRQLAGAFGQGERAYLRGPWRPGRPEDGFQLPLTPAQYFKHGLAAADRACVQLHGHSFAALDMTAAELFLQAVADGKIISEEVQLDAWFNETVYPLFTQACFSDPVYGGNRGKVFWKMIGYPGLPAVNGLNMTKYRGKPFPGAATPLSMEDFG
jgi:gluconate 2-dehydrogenase gamma chain